MIPCQLDLSLVDLNDRACHALVVKVTAAGVVGVLIRLLYTEKEKLQCSLCSVTITGYQEQHIMIHNSYHVCFDNFTLFNHINGRNCDKMAVFL